MANARARTSSSFILHLVPGLSDPCAGWRVLHKVEGADAFQALRTFEHLGMRERANAVVVAGCPVLLHRAAGELVILRDPLVTLGMINELYDVVDLLIGLLCQHLHLRCFTLIIRKMLEDMPDCFAEHLRVFELVSQGPGSA